MLDDSSVSRRQVLGVFTLGTAVALAGCSGGSGGSNGSGSDGATAGSTSTETSTATEQPDTETSTASNQDSMDEENEIPSWKNVDSVYEWQEGVYKDIEEGSATEFFAFAVDPEYVDESELEPSTYNGEPTSEQAFIHALTDDGEYEQKFLDEIFVVAQNLENESGPGDAFLDLFNNKGNHYGSISASDPDKQGQMDGFEHIDGEGIPHSSDLPEYVEQVLME